MKKAIAIGSMVLLGLFVLSLLSWGLERGAWGGEWGPPGHHGRISRLRAMLDNDRAKTYLNLTDPQVDRLRQILEDTQKSNLKTRADVAVRGIELCELLRADKPDRDTVMKKVQEISDLRAQMMKQDVEALLAAKTVLTPDQQKKLRSFFMTRGARGASRGRFGERPPTWRGPGRGPERPQAPPTQPGEPPVQ